MKSFKNISFIKILLFILSLFFQFTVIFSIIDRTVNNFTLVFFVTSLVFLYLSFPFRTRISSGAKKHDNSTFYLFTALIILIGLIIRAVLMFDAVSFHTDEYLSAYFSYSIKDLTKLDWFSVYPPTGIWVSQFPVLYFALQKLFFNIFGLSLITARLSTLPYTFTVFFMLFLIAKRLFNKETAFLAIALLAIFSPDIYLTRWSLSFISSTAFFLTATYYFILSIKVGKKIHYALSGFFLGLCYMTYYSSYVALPLLIIYMVILFVKKQVNKTHLRNLLLTAGMFLYVMSPILTYAVKIDNFFTQRIAQVKLINGLWSPYQNVEINTKSVYKILKTQTVLSVRAFYTDGIGGHGGYFFGKLALFDKITFIFLLTGIFYFIYKIIKNGNPNHVFILAVIFVTFITGMVLTFPPPAFHRFSLAFPFICLVIASTITDFYNFLKLKKAAVATVILALCVTVIASSNIIKFNKIWTIETPDNPDFPRIEQYLNKHNENNVYIAAFPSYGMGYVLYIMSGERIRSITKPLPILLGEIPKNLASTLVVLYPDDNTFTLIKRKFPEAKRVSQYYWHQIFSLN